MAGMKAGGTLLVGAVLGIVMVAVVFGGEAAVSTTAFCTSCHSMTYPAEELKSSSHYGALGANPGIPTVSVGMGRLMCCAMGVCCAVCMASSSETGFCELGGC